MWSLTKVYLHAHHFLYKLDYNSDWNTQEKIPTNIEMSRSEIKKKAEIRGGAQRGAGRVFQKEKLIFEKEKKYKETRGH